MLTSKKRTWYCAWSQKLIEYIKRNNELNGIRYRRLET